MHFEVKHQFHYHYSKEIFLEPTVVRLRPRDDFAQKLLSFELSIAPDPEDFSDSLDIFNNYQTELWFTEKQSSLDLTSHFQVETTLSNPFHYLVTNAQVLKLPAKYSPENKLALTPYLHRVQPDAAVDEWSGDRGVGVMYFSQQAVNRLLPAAKIALPATLGQPERLLAVQDLMAKGDERAGFIYKTIGVYLGSALALYADFYDFRQALILGRVTTGVGGDILMETARAVLQRKFPDTAARLDLRLPDEKSRRIGQAVAAASLPVIPKN